MESASIGDGGWFRFYSVTRNSWGRPGIYALLKKILSFRAEQGISPLSSPAEKKEKFLAPLGMTNSFG
jgi:hypothetical protein